jgi:hypothetical protein
MASLDTQQQPKLLTQVRQVVRSKRFSRSVSTAHGQAGAGIGERLVRHFLESVAGQRFKER